MEITGYRFPSLCHLGAHYYALCAGCVYSGAHGCRAIFRMQQFVSVCVRSRALWFGLTYVQEAARLLRALQIRRLTGFERCRPPIMLYIYTYVRCGQTHKEIIWLRSALASRTRMHVIEDFMVMIKSCGRCRSAKISYTNCVCLWRNRCVEWAANDE